MRDETFAELQAIVGPDGMTRDPAETLVYSYDAHHRGRCPEVVLWPREEEQVSAILRIAHREEIPVYARGSGSGRAGGSVPERGGIVLSFEKMDRILEIDTANRQVVVEPGVNTGRLKEVVETKSLFYPPDPASSDYSTIGGNIATSAGGLACLKYGTTKEYVQQLRVVLADGTAVTLGSKAQKSVTGYDLVHLFVGSEGTLGVIVRARLKLLPKPQNRSVLVAEFPTIEAAARAVTEIINMPATPTGIEFADRETLDCVRRFTDADIPEGCESMLLIQMDTPDADADIRKVETVCRGKGAVRSRCSENPEQAEALWDVRRSFSPATYKAAKYKVAEDTSVPAARIAEALNRFYQVAEKHGQRILCFGHAGDGNIHVNLLADDRDDPKVEATIEDIFRTVVELEGTLSGEHGIGTAKAKYLRLEFGDREIGLMEQVKRVFDPKGILNPGKIFDAVRPDQNGRIPE